MSEPTRSKSIVDWVNETCETFADSVAVTSVDESLTFSELWRRSDRLARVLVARGVQPETRVGLWAEQCCDLLVGIIGILASGAAYVPLEPSYPKNRLDFIASDAGLSLVVVPDHLMANASVLDISMISTKPGDAEAEAKELPENSGANAAYAIFTSGSTGQPKGVVVEHHSLVDLFQWLIQDFDLRPGDRYFATSSPAFDASIPALLLPLVTGGTLVVLANEATRDPYRLAENIEQHRPRFLQVMPTMLRMLAESGWKGDENLEFWAGGERMSPTVIEYIVPRVAKLINFYGPTETTFAVTAAVIKIDDVDSPVGVSPQHTGCVLLDSNGEIVLAGETGELFITGAQLARGYLNDPDLTAERFVTISPGNEVATRAYRTGDLARKRGDGSLVIQGRVDDQFKLRGYRIEPSEIEQRLLEHPQIIEVVVTSDQASEIDERRLLAFIRCSQDVDVSSVRAFARATLPDYMVPSVFIKLDEFPMSTNRKIDKKRLNEIFEAGTSQVSVEIETSDGGRPQTEVEKSVFRSFASVLNIGEDEFGVNDDFFDLGGTSLGCVRLFMMIEDGYGVRLPLSTLVTSPTVHLLALTLADNLNVEGGSITERDQPLHEWERVLCNVWAEILERDEVGTTDNFFEIGGTESDADHLFEQLRIVYGIDVSLAELRRAPTIKQLAELTGGRSIQSEVVPLNTEGSNTPFFCIAGSGGLALNFLPLARLLGPEQPFYGLQTHAIESRGIPDFTLNHAANRYAKAIRNVQPHGPYLIGGHSLGGVLALKVAQRLTDAGEHVALLAVFDTSLTRRLRGPESSSRSVESTGPHRSRVFQERTKITAILFLPFAGIVPRKGLGQFEVFGLHSTIQARFAKRLRKWSGRTAVYVSSDQFTDVTHDWQGVLTGSWSSVTVPGDHLSMMQRPNVALLAESLRGQISVALGFDDVPTMNDLEASGNTTEEHSAHDSH
jgi:amino acid adenylation domain-containing protein